MEINQFEIYMFYISNPSGEINIKYTTKIIDSMIKENYILVKLNNIDWIDI